MSGAPAGVTRGVRALRRLLREQDRDVRSVDLAGFRDWLGRHLAHWQRDPAFRLRAEIRDLRRVHPRLMELEEEHHRATAADAASARFPRLRQLEQEVISADRAIAGLSAAVSRKPPGRRGETRRKLAEFRARRRAARTELAALVRSSPERQALLRVGAELRRLRAAVGLDEKDAELARLFKERGRRTGRSGESFEHRAIELTHDVIARDLARRGGESAGRLRVLRGVTLGAAGVEFDQLLVREPRRGGRPVEVLAAVEVKRNINDVAHGFRRRQADLAWLTGDATRYDAAAYRTRRFPSGDFDREAVHEQDGETFRFTRRSFRLFRRDQEAGVFLERLYFITRVGPLWGLSTAALSRVGHRVATDVRWEPESEACLRRLLRWCRSLAEPVEAPDILRIYAGTARLGRQVVLVDSR